MNFDLTMVGRNYILFLTFCFIISEMILKTNKDVRTFCAENYRHVSLIFFILPQHDIFGIGCSLSLYKDFFTCFSLLTSCYLSRDIVEAKEIWRICPTKGGEPPWQKLLASRGYACKEE